MTHNCAQFSAITSNIAFTIHLYGLALSLKDSKKWNGWIMKCIYLKFLLI